MRISDEPRSCPICASLKRREIYHQRFESGGQVGLISEYHVGTCEECGFAFASPLPKQAEFDRYYTELSKYERSELPQTGQQAAYDLKRFPIHAEIIRSLVPHPNPRCLDIGCANGGLLNSLRDTGITDVIGLDPSPSCVANAAHLYNVQVVSGTASKIPPSLGKFDLIILGSVLEHIRDLREIVTSFRNHLHPGGYVYIEVPDVTRFPNVVDAPFQEFSIEHINFFSPTSLNNLFLTCGFLPITFRRDALSPSPGTLVHELKSVFQIRSEDGSPQQKLIPDADSFEALRSYVQKCIDFDQNIWEKIASFVDNNQPIVVWGVGTHTQRLLAESRLSRANIVAFIDSNSRYWNKTLAGAPILGPEDLRSLKEPILISSRAFQNEIVVQIRENLGLQNELILLYSL